MGALVGDLGDDPRFEDRAAQRMRVQLLGCADAKQVTDEPSADTASSS